VDCDAHALLEDVGFLMPTISGEGEEMEIELSADELLNRMMDKVDKLAEQIYAGIQDYLVGEGKMVPWDSLSPRDQGGYRHAARRVLNWQARKWED
jgi:hypothetical protein